MTVDPAEQAIIDTLKSYGPGASICPTQAARFLAGNPKDDSWRRGLASVKLAAQRLAKAGQIEILRKGKPIGPQTLHGVIRLRMVNQEA